MTAAIPTIRPADLAARKAAGEAFDLIDVRTPVEFREIHCSFARNLPLSDLDPAQLPPTTGRPLFVICKSGSRGRQACEKLMAAGFEVCNVEGGTQAWAEAGLPVQRGAKAMSLERQVRIAAGLMVLLGVGLGFVHPVFFGLAAFVGAGLVFAGVTDTCGMGLLLARMPWNRVAVLVLLACSTSVSAQHTTDSLATVKKSLLEKKATLVDVRELAEWNDGHLKDAQLLPLSSLKSPKADDVAKVCPRDKVVYLHCGSGVRCLKAAETLKKLGYDARPLKAGYKDLLKAGFAPAKE